MAQCEEYPYCGHELGCYPSVREDSIEPVHRRCMCGAKIPLWNPANACDSCMWGVEETIVIILED